MVVGETACLSDEFIGRSGGIGDVRLADRVAAGE